MGEVVVEVITVDSDMDVADVLEENMDAQSEGGDAALGGEAAYDVGDTETDTEETDQAYVGRLEELRKLLSGALGRLDELEMEAEDTDSEVKDWMRTAEAFLGAGWWEAVRATEQGLMPPIGLAQGMEDIWQDMIWAREMWDGRARAQWERVRRQHRNIRVLYGWYEDRVAERFGRGRAALDRLKAADLALLAQRDRSEGWQPGEQARWVELAIARHYLMIGVEGLHPVI